MTTDIPKNLLPLKHYLSVRDIGCDQFAALVDFAIARKSAFKRGELAPAFQGKVLAMIFQKSSLRTRLGFEAAMAQLGGHAINLEDHQIGVNHREEIKDIARVMASMCDVIVARVFAHQTVIELAAHSVTPVINGLSDWAHPCQALADVMTIREHFGDTQGLRVAYIGDSNNVSRSLMNACVRTGMSFNLATPEGYEMDQGVMEFARSEAAKTQAEVSVTTDPGEAVADVDVIYTDVWTSMGQEDQRAQREKDFAAYQVNAKLLERAKSTAVVMHCLPANRNQEITDEVIDGSQSIIFQQAENRLHSQRALLEVLLSRQG